MNPTDWNPGTLLETSGYYWKTCTLHTAVKLDIFSIIGSGKISAAEITKELQAEPQAVLTLLNALSAMNLLKKDEEDYTNNSAATEFLSKDSPSYIGHIITHHSHLVESWAKMDRAVLTGKPVRGKVSHGDEETRESFLMGMFDLGMFIAPKLASEIDLSKQRNLLDLGGGPGTYAIHFCLSNPELEASIYDLPTTRPFAEKIIEKFGITGIVNFVSGNYLENDIPGEYDTVWLSQILHGESPENCLMIIKKAVSVLNPGGLILIHEFILENSLDSPLFPALFSLNMLIGTDGGRSYSEEQLADMLDKNGITDIKRLDFTGKNDSGIIAGVKQ